MKIISQLLNRVDYTRSVPLCPVTFQRQGTRSTEHDNTYIVLLYKTHSLPACALVVAEVPGTMGYRVVIKSMLGRCSGACFILSTTTL